MLTAPKRPDRDNERGGVALAMMVLMLVTALGVVAFSAGSRGLGHSRGESSSGRAAAAAELGISEAIARIVGGATSSLSSSGSTDGVIYSYDATTSDGTSWVIYGEGRDGGRTRALEITLGGSSTATEDPLTLFLVSRLALKQNKTAISGRVGTNGEIDVTGSSSGASQDLFGPGASCSGCSNPVAHPEAWPVPDVSAPTSGTRPCPSEGKFQGAVDGEGGTPIVCESGEVKFVGAVHVVNGPLVIYVGPGAKIEMESVNINNGGSVADFSLFVEGSKEFKADKAKITGTVVAPARTVKVSRLTIVGSLTLDTLTGEDKSSIKISPDPDAPTGDGGGGSSSWELGTIGQVDPR
jgi:hypothetical protein